ncbi:MBL fold metallo-hydrolase [Lacibacter sediminis]|uniref:MBL fold metallo-hydrolase n=1 Tax=Lacibacter sediminis TaxID=2760713 RepID=A0A7G5XET3_9BACT|nr:MBL fold metallo-hydrolase [Lacibacter sediminis]QNA43986.1 MBL fold metallo-hydrolase [Lacibacter sediminis]
MNELQLYLNYAGYCEASEHHAIRNGRKQTIKFHALFGLIRHPAKGWILFDTGYTQRFHEATRNFPNRIYALITKVHISEEDEVKQQLKKFGLTTDDISYVIISHFHADHIGGLKDFTKAIFYCSAAAYSQVKRISTVLGFTKGILKPLLPDDFEDRLRIIEEYASAEDDEIFGRKYDLFNDGYLIIYQLPGHAAGQIGLLLKTNKQTYFLVADACWLKESYKDLILPHPSVRFFFHSWIDYKQSLKKIHTYHQQNPATIIVPTHCSVTTRDLVSQKADITLL